MKIYRATPSLPVDDLNAAREFAETCLGFRTLSQDDRHVLCNRDAAFIRFINAAPDADMADEARQLVLYLDVDDVDAFWSAKRASLKALPKGRVREPFDQPYGQRELHVIHGPFLFILGHPLSKEQT